MFGKIMAIIAITFMLILITNIVFYVFESWMHRNDSNDTKD